MIVDVVEQLKRGFPCRSSLRTADRHARGMARGMSAPVRMVPTVVLPISLPRALSVIKLTRNSITGIVQ